MSQSNGGGHRVQTEEGLLSKERAMTTKADYSLTYIKDAWAKRIAGMTLFWLYIGFLVWLSLGSTFWTFIFGTLAIGSIATRFTLMWKEHHYSFSTKQELMAFVQGLPDDR